MVNGLKYKSLLYRKVRKDLDMIDSAGFVKETVLNELKLDFDKNKHTINVLCHEWESLDETSLNSIKYYNNFCREYNQHGNVVIFEYITGFLSDESSNLTLEQYKSLKGMTIDNLKTYVND